MGLTVVGPTGPRYMVKGTAQIGRHRRSGPSGRRFLLYGRRSATSLSTLWCRQAGTLAAAGGVEAGRMPAVWPGIHRHDP